MGIVKFIWLLLCGFMLSFLGALAIMVEVGTVAGVFAFILMPLMFWCLYVAARWFAEHSTPPISFFTESDIGMWFAHRFNPWLGSCFLWFLIGTVSPAFLISQTETENAKDTVIEIQEPEGGPSEDEGL